MMPLEFSKTTPCGVNQSHLNVNEACLNISSTVPYIVDVLVRNSECYKCEFRMEDVIDKNASVSFIIDTQYPLELKLVTSNASCTDHKWFDDFGSYAWNIGSLGCSSITITEEPESFWLNIGIVFCVLVGFILLYRIVKCSLKTTWCNRLLYGSVPFQELQADLGEPCSRSRNLARARRQTRVATIDVFRGVTIALMVFVNYGGGQYSVFKHAPWNGLTVADVVFPFFVWSMGISTVISLRSQLRASLSRKQIFYRVVRRSVILIGIGIVLNSGKADERKFLRIPGVLQRIGISYFFVASIELLFGKPQRSERYGPWNVCSEVVDSMFQWLMILILVAIHTSITFFLSVPGCPLGYIGPGGLADSASNENCTGGAAGYIDRLIFTPRHIYQHPTSQKIYHSDVPYDPEGLLGILTSVLVAYLGVHCGRIILTYERTNSRLKRWILVAFITGISAGFLCSWSKEDGIIPINKNLWSLSYALATTSMAYFTFSLLYLLVDHTKWWSGGPFLYAGMNSIVIYIGHSVLNKQLPWRWTPISSSHLELLLMDITATTLWIFIGFLLYRKNVFITI